MIQAHFGIIEMPFSAQHKTLLPHQQEVFDMLSIHSRQGGLCLVIGEPGTGKSVIKDTIKSSADKTTEVITITRTMHTYSNILKILCELFKIEDSGIHFKCEKRLIEEAYAMHRLDKVLITIIDEAHLIEMEILRKLRLLFDEFPRNHNLILIGQPYLMAKLAMRTNDDMKSRITYSTTLLKLTHDDIENFILQEMDRINLGHNTFTDEAIGLIARSADGIIRKARNLALSAMLEAVRAQKRTVDIELINKVLVQPHWRMDYDIKQG